LPDIGIIFNKNIKWVVFHGSFDFAYLLKLMKGEELPLSMEEFNKDIKTYFPNIYDLKFIIKDLPNLKEVGLNRLS
jgi:CCR4-NOT transcription complex subunit 7/8